MNKNGMRCFNSSSTYKITLIIVLFILGFIAMIASVCLGTMSFSVKESLHGIFVNDDSAARLIIWNVRLPRTLSGGLVGICLALSGCILQGVMRNHLASPSTIGVTSGASFVGYLTLVAFPGYYHLLPIGSITGGFFTTLGIYLLAYNKGVSPVKIILSGMAVSTVFSAFNDMIRSFFPEKLANATGFLVGSLNGVAWKNLIMILPYALIGILLCLFVPSKMNILMLGDEMANSLGVRTESFRLFLILVSSLLAGAAISVAGLINFVGLIVPHIARLLVGSDYKYLLPASIALGYMLIIICDLIGRIVLPVGEISVSVVLSFVGAPFFLCLLRNKEAK
ncbi:FecCD family ABC transporter permease [Lutispora thermophila]|uniref:Iron complex transport system permease protein n=1 Tax=Lutispora thermophila DSM 19022 TaxID=1122184 RepID=A0A1M6H9M8_9FIRM|nr:iron ABC transporter permease [Lutispora thermophila]SHJ18932.1 iron complex transport system permease protein [Lutispora thermophila DSM 19022]